MLYKIRLGDWSHDGHGITREFRVEVNYPFADLQANYLKNTERFGFGLEDLASDFEDTLFPATWRDSLVEAGFDDEGTLEEYEGQHYLSEDSLIAVGMFLLGDGLSGFRWSYADDNADLLFGGGRLQDRRGHLVSGGYGLYTP